MSDNAPQETTSVPKARSPMKMIAIIATIMLIEGGAVYFFMLKSGPQAIHAAEVVTSNEPDPDESIEIPLLAEKFQNMQTGRVWVWDTQIVLKVKRRNEIYVKRQLESRAAEVAEGVAMIFRRAQHAHLREPGLETINRQLTAFLADMLGKDSDNKPRVDRVILPKCKGFPAD
jgi:flagellar basal body-associated protein FliL